MTAYSIDVIDVIVDKLITDDTYAVKCCILELESILLLITYYTSLHSYNTEIWGP